MMNFLLEDPASDKNYFIYSVPGNVAADFAKIMKHRIISEDADLERMKRSALTLQKVVFGSEERWKNYRSEIPVISIASIEELNT